MASRGLSAWEDRIDTVSQSAFALNNHWRTASRTASFMHDLSILVGEINNVVDHGPPAIKFLGRFHVNVEGCGVVGQETANGPKPFALRQIGARDDQDVNVALVGCIATPVASKEN